MHSTSFLVGALAAVSMVVAQEPAHLVARDDASSSPTPTEKHHRTHSTAAWETQDPSAASKYHSDMKSLKHSIKKNPMYTSMKGALATAIPQSYREAMHTNAASLNKQYSTGHPEWYTSLPADVRSFIESNQKAAKSIAEKDLGPKATEVIPPSIPGTNGKAKDSKAKGAKSEASPLKIIGATIGALTGALGVAILLL